MPWLTGEMPVLPLRTERLTLRMMDEQHALDDLPASGPAQIAIEHAGTVVGDLTIGFDETGQIAELAVTVAREHRGQGFAGEAAGALIDALFAAGEVQRIVASIDPTNFASMRVLENLGFQHEVTARHARCIGGEWVDDMRFAVLRDDRTDWLARPTTCHTVELVELTTDNLRAVSALATHRHQQQFVAPMARSLAQALVPPLHDDHPVVPWLRAVQADGEIVGFMMVSAPSPGEPVPFLWRFLIDRRHQRRGAGRRAIQLLADAWRAEGHDTLLVSWGDGPGGPRPFYEGLGFVPTGVVSEGEFEAALDLSAATRH